MQSQFIIRLVPIVVVLVGCASAPGKSHSRASAVSALHNSTGTLAVSGEDIGTSEVINIDWGEEEKRSVLRQAKLLLDLSQKSADSSIYVKQYMRFSSMLQSLPRTTNWTNEERHLIQSVPPYSPKEFQKYTSEKQTQARQSQIEAEVRRRQTRAVYLAALPPLERKLEELTDSIGELEERVADLESEIQDKDSEIEALKSQADETEVKLGDLESQLSLKN